MSYAIFPTLVNVPAQIKKRPTWNTAHERTAAGNEFRTGFQQFPVNEFDITYPFLSQADKNALEGFLNEQGGSLTPFYFDVLNDDTITAPFGFGTSDGVTAAWTIEKPAGTGAAEPIGGQLGVFGTVTAPGVTVLFDNGTPIPVTNYNFSDGQLGSIVTFGVGHIPVSGHVMTWTGSYRYLVRFKEDKIEFTQFANGLYKTGNITLVQCL